MTEPRTEKEALINASTILLPFQDMETLRQIVRMLFGIQPVAVQQPVAPPAPPRKKSIRNRKRAYATTAGYKPPCCNLGKTAPGC